MFIAKKNKKAETCEGFTCTRSSGFTLTEIIVVIVIIAALALVLIPNMLKMMPDDHNLKYKKAFYTIQEIVDDIASECQGMSYNSADDTWSAAANDNVLSYCYNDANPPTAKNLAIEICTRLSTTDTCPDIDDANTINGILTTNGMRWNLINAAGQSLGTGGNWGPVIVAVDIDGCGDNAVSNYTNAFGSGGDQATCVNPAGNDDQGVYRINISSNGKITPTGEAEQKLLLKKPTDD